MIHSSHPFNSIDKLMTHLHVEITRPWVETIPVFRASGREDLQIIPVINNVQFQIKPDLEDLITRVLIDFGEDGMDFLKQEAKEWMSYDTYINPGKAIEEQPARWKPLLNDVGEMDYTYHDRLQWQREYITNQLANPDYSRQIYMSVWDSTLDLSNIRMGGMVPCVLGYYFDKTDRGDKESVVTTTVIMRSCDLDNCLVNDIYLAKRLQDTLIRTANTIRTQEDRTLVAGPLVFNVMNLHVYPKKIYPSEEK